MSGFAVELHVLLPNRIPVATASADLSNDELERAARFRFSTDRDRWIGWRSGLRQVLAAEICCAPQEVPIELSATGKPLLGKPWDALHFNLSHCDELALVAVSRHGPIGVDIEPLDRATGLLGCEGSFCHPQEIAKLPEAVDQRAAALLRIWTAKEAVLKALGSGLLQPPEAISIHFDERRAVSNESVAGLSDQRLHFPQHPALNDYLVAVSAPLLATGVIWL